MVDTPHERRRYEIAGTDQAALVLIDGEAVAWTDDYCTAHLIAGTDATPTQESVETFVQQAIDFYGWAKR